ncbi:phosphoribosylamine--glycine ligase, partial [bacterium]
MRILVVGSGGREHALAWKLAQEHEVVCTPGNPGIAEDVETVPVAASDTDGIVALAKGFDLVVVGPEDPLVNGLGDALRAAGAAVYGPNADGARLEASKAFSKEVMVAAGIRTAQHVTFTDASAAQAYARLRFAAGQAVAVKASGNALGKGVVVCASLDEAEDAINQMLVDRAFGEAGAEVVIEDRLEGPEFSLL